MNGARVGSELLDHQLRRHDFTLPPEHEQLSEVLDHFLQQHCRLQDVRDAEPLGYSSGLWGRLRTAAVLPGEGGETPTMLEGVLAAEIAGRHLAPMPVAEYFVINRLDDRIGGDPSLEATRQGNAVVGFAIEPLTEAQPLVVPVGAIARAVVALRGDRMLLLESETPAPHEANIAALPLGRWGSQSVSVELLRGGQARQAWELARSEWQLLVAAYLSGLVEAVTKAAISYARERRAFGRTLLQFQAISHLLVDAQIAAAGSARLVRKAAWFSDHEPDEAAGLVPLAVVASTRAALGTAELGIHVQGGLGLTTESDMQLYLRRGSGLSALLGRSSNLLRQAGARALRSEPPSRLQGASLP